jgi:hypothetical protein
MGIESRSLAQPITFDFENGSAFDDNAGVGANMVASNGATAVIMTTVDLLAPQYAEDPAGSGIYVPTSATLSAAGGANVVTNILSANNSVGINNPSITNGQYEDNFGSTLTESGNFNLGEAWVFQFSADVLITEFNFSSLNGVDNDQFTVTVSGVPGSFTFEDGTSFDDFEDPLGELIILAGTPITLEATGQINGSVRISEITVLPTDETGGPLLGDYNGDLKVSAADYTVWRDTLGSTTDLRADGAAAGSSSGVIDQDDYDVWINQYGQSQFGATLAARFVVPEPPALGIFAATLLAGIVVSRPRLVIG